METSEWKKLINQAKQDKKYHMLRTCVLGWLIDDKQELNLLNFYPHYSSIGVKTWAYDEMNYYFFSKILKEGKKV